MTSRSGIAATTVEVPQRAESLGDFSYFDRLPPDSVSAALAPSLTLGATTGHTDRDVFDCRGDTLLGFDGKDGVQDPLKVSGRALCGGRVAFDSPLIHTKGIPRSVSASATG